jgi:hypothetical protein
MMLWHFTTAVHLPWILRDGYLRPTRHILRLPDRQGLVWFTTEGRKPDPTATARGKQYPEQLWMRLGASWSTMPWVEACQAAGWLPGEIALAEYRATELHRADPSKWRAARGNVPLGDDLEVAAWRGDRWERTSPHIEMVSADGGECAEISWCGRRLRAMQLPGAGPRGQTGYAIKLLS